MCPSLHVLTVVPTITEWEFTPPDPFGNSYCKCVSKPQSSPHSGLTSWCLVCDIISCWARSPLIGPSHSTVSLWPLWPPVLKTPPALGGGGGTRSHLTCRPHRALSRVRQWQRRGERIPRAVWCVSVEVWIRTDSCTEDPAAARGRGSHRPSRTTSSPRT